MRRPIFDKEGKATKQTEEDALEFLARKGNETAIRELEGPEFPVLLQYLWEWHRELSLGRREGSMSIGVITWGDVESWARQTRRDLAPHEVLALVRMDAYYRNPDSLED